MNGSRPYLVTLLVSLLLVVALYFLHQIDRFTPHLTFSGVLTILFIGLTAAGIYFAEYAARSSNKNTYLQVFLGFMMAKLFLSVLVIIVYFFEFEPVNRYFVVPFVLIYLTYSAVETFYFMKIGRRQSVE